jgi:hypothetical protein
LGQLEIVGRVREQTGMFIPSDNLKRINVDHPAACGADIPIGPPIPEGWFHLISIGIAGVKAIAIRSIAANANPGVFIARFANNICA